MFIHLGGDTVLRSNKVIVILDHQSQDMSADNQQFLQDPGKKDTVVLISEEKPKSIVVTDEKIYLSPISSQTLKRRAETVAVFEEDDY
ncbi:protein of unknown function [Evansella caseinilytica]|uniref:DUF370 domain-containing protein n=1 Tax=Evansella caseinilytica TaxID=1503961 RepID=A0A1H3URG8_9BACI|nr:DUF370 domain-containing protein [Evansella caseinilytica]SDZ65033.1 protein of unknown function [Evansella caseinilytica]